MLAYPNIDPVAFSVGPLVIYWYGIMYLLGFSLALWLCQRQGPMQRVPWTSEQVTDLLFYVALGVIFGGTLGYILFYEPHILLENPVKILRFWDPGRSFHGGLMGVVVAVFLFCYVKKRHFLDVMDFIAPAVPLGLATGRLGNFMNSELWGRVTDLPWGMVFPNGGALARHPSQLYEFLLEGLLLWIILQWYIKKPRPRGHTAGLFSLLYGLFRFVVEFFREPDLGQGFVLGDWLTMGQMLSIPMIMIGLGLFLVSVKEDKSCSNI